MSLTVRLLVAAALAATLSGCAAGAYSPAGLSPGTPRAEVLRRMGPPTGDYTMADGRERLEYNHMPAGRQTYMIDLDAGGRLVRWDNVLAPRTFAAIAPGMGPDDVRRLIGPPSEKGRYARPAPAVTWMYRYETVERCTLFEVSFDAASGRVIDASAAVDPDCPDNRAR